MEVFGAYEGVGIMNNFILAVSVVFPLVVYMAVGMMIRRLHIFSEGNFKQLNGLIFRIFIPLTLFFNVYEVDLGDISKICEILVCVLGIPMAYVTVWIVLRKRIQDRAVRATMVQGMYRINFVLFGNSIGLSLCAQGGIPFLSAMQAVVVPIYNILAVVLFELESGKNVNLRKLLVSILKNPLVDAGVL